MVAWTETSEISEGVEMRKEMVLASWLSNDEADVFWPSGNYRYHLINGSVPDSDWYTFPVDAIIARDLSEEECEKVLNQMSQEETEVCYELLGIILRAMLSLMPCL